MASASTTVTPLSVVLTHTPMPTSTPMPMPSPTSTSTSTSTSMRVPSRAVTGAIESAIVRNQIRQRLLSHPSTSSEDLSDEQSIDKHTTAAVPRQATVAGEKKRKPTYYMRKDEMAQLQHEISTLQSQVQRLESQPQCIRESVDEMVHRNAGLRSHIRHCDLTVASAQSLLATYGSQQRTPPLGGYIHLPKEPLDRQSTLQALKMPRMKEAVAYALARCQFLDVTKTIRQMENYETDTGDFVTTHWEITALPEARSVWRVFKEVMYFTETQEISMSEKLGVLTIRESESEMVDGTQCVRMLSKHDNGLQVETNLAVFSHYFDNSEMLHQPHALHVVDYVDRDDLYSFQPQSRIHKEVTAMVMVTEVPATREGDQPVVTMIRWAFVRVKSSAYTTRQDLDYIAREGVDKWCNVMLRCVRERLAWKS